MRQGPGQPSHAIGIDPDDNALVVLESEHEPSGPRGHRPGVDLGGADPDLVLAKVPLLIELRTECAELLLGLRHHPDRVSEETVVEASRGRLVEWMLVGGQAAGLRGRRAEGVLGDSVAVLVVIDRDLPPPVLTR